MAPSSVGCSSSIEQLKRQLAVTFGCPEIGSLNIAALQKLLHNLIELHASYRDDRKENSTASQSYSLNLPGIIASKEALIRPSTTNTNRRSDIILDSTGTPDSENSKVPECFPSIPCDESISEDLPDDKDVPYPDTECSIQVGMRSDQRIHDENSLPTEDIKGILPGKNIDVFSNSSEEIEQANVVRSSDIILQRNSDFNVKSTSLLSSESSLPMCNQKGSNDAETKVLQDSFVIQNVAKKVRDTSDRVAQEHVLPGEFSSQSGTTETLTKSDFPIVLPDLLAIMNGCKSHLETVMDELSTLKNSCQRQQDDMLKLVSGLDNLAKRLDDQEPKVLKNVKDTHCIGMLISDYEQCFARIQKRLEQNDIWTREFERAIQRMNKDRDAVRGDLRAIGEQANYLSKAKADKLDVQTELCRRALTTDLQLRVPYDVFNDGVRELTHFVTQMREELHGLEENLKTVQYELVRGLSAKASAQEVSQIRKQLVSVLARWQKAEKSLQASVDDATTQMIRGNYHSAAVTVSGSISNSTGPSTCLSCGVQTTLQGSKSVIPVAVRFIPSWKAKSHARNAGGCHTICTPSKRISRTESLGTVPNLSMKRKQ